MENKKEENNMELNQKIFEECFGDNLDVSTEGFSAGFVDPSQSKYAYHFYLVKSFLFWKIIKSDCLIGTWRQIFNWFSLNHGFDLPEDFINFYSLSEEEINSSKVYRMDLMNYKTYLREKYSDKEELLVGWDKTVIPNKVQNWYERQWLFCHSEKSFTVWLRSRKVKTKK